MDGLDLSTTTFSLDGESSSEAILPSSSTRKAFVTFDVRTTLDSGVVLGAISSFLKEKVFPVIGEHCEINLHWDGVDLSTLHVRSIVPDNFVLVSRTTSPTTSARNERTSSRLIPAEGDRHPTSPAAHITIKEEPIDVTDDEAVHEIKQELNVDCDDASSDDGKLEGAPLVGQDLSDGTDHHSSAGCSISDKPYSHGFRPKPPAPAAAATAAAAAAAAPYSMYFPQNSMIPMIPLMAFGQPQLPYHQVTPMLFSPMQSLPQMPLPGLMSHGMVPGYNPYLQSPFNLQSLPYSSQFSQPLPNDAAAEASVLLQRTNRYM